MLLYIVEQAPASGTGGVGKGIVMVNVVKSRLSCLPLTAESQSRFVVWVYYCISENVEKVVSIDVGIDERSAANAFDFA